MNRLVLLLLALLPLNAVFALDPPCPTVQWVESQRVAVAGTVRDVAAFDYDMDGKLDVIGRVGTTLTWWKGVGDGTLANAAVLSPLPVHFVVTAEVNGDAFPDVVALATSAGLPVLLIANGSAAGRMAFAQSAFVAADGVEPLQLDADPARELAMWDEEEAAVRFFDLSGSAYVELASSALAVSGTARRVVSRDLDADGFEDLIVNTSWETTAYFGAATASFSSATHVPVPSKDFVVADADDDGDPDIAGIDSSYRRSIAWNEGGGFSWARITDDPRFFGALPSFVTIADANGDGVPDAIVLSADARSVQTFSGVGDRAFRYSTIGGVADATSSATPVAAVTGRFDADDDIEVVITMTDALLVMSSSCAAQIHLSGPGYAIAAGKPVTLTTIVRGFAPSTVAERGTVVIRDADGVVVGEAPVDATGRAGIEVASFPAGEETLTAEFSGNTEHPAGTSAPVDFVISEPSALRIVVPSEPSYYDKPWRVSIEGACCENSTVTLTVDGQSHTTHGTEPVWLRLEPGPHTLVATFGGSATHAPGESPALNIVTRKAETQLFLEAGSVVLSSGDPLSLRFRLMRNGNQWVPSAPVTLRGATGTVASGVTSDGGFVIFAPSLADGSHPLHVAFAGDEKHEGTTSETIVVDVFPATGFHLGAHAHSSEIRLNVVVPFYSINHWVYRRVAGSTSWTPIPCPRLGDCFDSSAQRGILYEYRVEALDESSVAHFSNIDSAMLFSDDPLVARQTRVRASHLTELRVAINDMRKKAGLPVFDFGSSMAPGKQIAAAHFELLRVKAFEALGISATVPPFAGRTVLATDLRELRDLTR